MVALGETIRRFDIPPEPFLNLLTAFEQDQRVKQYDTFEQLLGYCRNSANPVGHLVLYLFECFDAERAALADEVCTGLQLANFWQDVARDFAIGRVYIPGEDRRRFGYPDEDLEARRFTSAFAELMRFEVERTRGLFARGLPLADRVNRRVAREVRMFASGGLTILERLEQSGYSPVERRPRLSARDKLRLLRLGLVGA